MENLKSFNMLQNDAQVQNGCRKKIMRQVAYPNLSEKWPVCILS